MCVYLKTFHSPYAVLPELYTLSYSEAQSQNSSTRNGHCTNTLLQPRDSFTCGHPSSSVLFDRSFPSLALLDSDTWARRLLTLKPATSTTSILFDFSSQPYDWIEGVEVTMFNCPRWGIGIESIRLLGSADTEGNGVEIGSNRPAFTSCDALVKVCLPVKTVQPVLTLLFTLAPGSEWVHLAEVEFYTDTRTCTPAPPDLFSGDDLPYGTLLQ